MAEERKFLTDEEYNKLFDEVAKNEALTPDEMDALTEMRNDMYARMAYMKDNDDYREKYDDLTERYKRRWRDGDEDRDDRRDRGGDWKGFREKERDERKGTVTEPNGEKIRYEDIFEKKEEK